ncbi:hypothetical protein BD309DRAFT_872776 [Dichomitus squalens]|uniref:Uncharacterized protein n=1 Tax=Dichomitus squalens TaxID=114155 RepID=A0A4V2K6I1_9APHY|nr:hypothetical protein BD309DRAFT_872776 [Dichomitus squalens]TBU52213.1 hypothetical protein BD310DRAFT_832741 [Dichomitus squalens]
MALVAPSSTSLRIPTAMDVDPAVFAQVSEAHLRNGAIPVSHYLNDLDLLASLPSTSSVPPHPPPPAQQLEPTIPKAVAKIHQACQQAFGNTQAVKFDFEEDPISHGKRCTLTLIRPDGATRTYTSPTVMSRKYDAKASVCTLAIQSGALEFIGGEPKGGSPLASAFETPGTALEMDDSVKAIEQCCLEWASGRVKPHWLMISEPKFGKTQGCALRIRLSRRDCRVYSVSTVYNSAAEAKKACAEAALAEGVIDFIKSWTASDTDMDVDEVDSSTALSLEQFFESLPQPFPEPVAGRTAVDINGPAWLNTTIQSARGGKIVPKFVYTVDPRYNFHGCLLRLECPGAVKSYLVDARFAKRNEAKAAVCLLAMSEGVGEYIRGVGQAVKDKLPPAVRRHVSSVLLPLLNAEYRKVRGPGMQPGIEYDQELDACGATMTIELAPNAGPQQVRRYTVPAEYCSRNDARLAVVHHAVQEGVIDFLRWHGNTPPLGYVPYTAQQEQHFASRKRKNWEPGSNSNGGYGNGGEEWSTRNVVGGAPSGTWQNKRLRTGVSFPADPGYGLGGSQPSSTGRQGQGFGRSQAHIPPGGGYPIQQSTGRPLYVNGQVTRSAKKEDWKHNYHNASGLGGPGSHFSPRQYKFGPSVSDPSRSTQAIVPPSATYASGTMLSSQLSYSPPYTYPEGGVVSQGAQPGPPGSYGAVLHAQPIPIPYQNPAPPPPLPPYNAMSSNATTYPPPAVPAVPATPAPIHHPQLQYPNAHGYLTAFSPAPVPVYQPYPVVPPPPPVTTSIVNAPSVLFGPETLPPPVPQPPPTPPPPLPPTPTQVKPDRPPQAQPSPPAPKPFYLADPLSAWPTKPKAPGKVVSIQSTPKTNVSALYDYCNEHHLPTPQWCHEMPKDQPGEKKHKVWVVIGKMKFELPVTFSSLGQGQEKVAKKVVDQFKAHGHGDAAKWARSKA